MRFIYGLISLACLGFGLYKAYHAWSWWSLAWIGGALVVALILQAIAGAIGGDFKR